MNKCRNCIYYEQKYEGGWCFHKEINKSVKVRANCPVFKSVMSEDYDQGYEEGYEEGRLDSEDY